MSSLLVKTYSPECVQYNQITPEMIVDSLTTLTYLYWRDPIDFTIILNYIEGNFRVNPNLTELENELCLKLRVAEEAGIVKGDEYNRWRLCTSLEDLRHVRETRIGLFWRLHCDTINPLEIKRKRPIKIIIQKKEDSDSSDPPSDG